MHDPSKLTEIKDKIQMQCLKIASVYAQNTEKELKKIFEETSREN